MTASERIRQARELREGRGYDHSSEWHQGCEDAQNGYPRRLHQTAPYRAGYDHGITKFATAIRHSVEGRDGHSVKVDQ